MSALSRIAAKADQMIRRYGSAMTLTRTAPGTVSDAGAVTAGASTTNTTTGVFLPLTSYTDNREEINTLAQRKVRYLLLSAKGMTLEPQPQDVVTHGSNYWRVESSTPINPKGTAIAHQTLAVQL